LSIANQKKFYRWVLLRHIDSPDDSKGIHFDLLLEDEEFCMTWRLSDIPQVDGPYVDAIYITPHKLEWLEIREKVVSGNRGVATRIKQGFFLRSFSRIQNNYVNLSMQWETLDVYLIIDAKGCKICRKEK
tara:strand:+ start:216 stop:605 length:390 start_codon:yes stop_codon:yes gene_type:complete